MNEYTLMNLEMNERIYNMFMNVHKKYAIYRKGDEGQRGTRRTLPKMAKTMNMGRMFLKSVFSKHFVKNYIL